MNHEGPTTHTIAAHTRTTCGQCVHHKCTGSFHTPGSWREYSCMHPLAYPEETDPKKAELRGMLRASEDGRPIGRTELTPSWCPFRRTNP